MAVQLAGSDVLRWIALLKGTHELPTADRDRLIQAFSHAVDRISAEQFPALWKELTKITRHHRAYPTAKWVMAESQIAALEQIAARIAPEEPGIQDEHLFTERFPDIPRLEPAKLLEQLEGLRKNAIERIMTSFGVQGVVDFALRVEAPSIVGGIFGSIAESPLKAMDAILVNEALPKRPIRFSSGVSGAAFMRFGDAWLSQVQKEVALGRIHVELLESLSEWWPITPSIWNWIRQFGEDAEKRFWQTKPPWGLKSNGEELAYVVNQYLRFERPEFVIEALSDRSSEIPSLQLVEALVAFERQIAVRPELVQSASFHLQQVFQSLRTRADLALESVAALEYRYLPLLRELWAAVDPESALDRYLAQSPAFFVQVVADVFRPASKRKSPMASLTPEGEARAQIGITLLESFSRVPGQSANDIESAVLDKWVQEVQSIATEQDRSEMAEQYIGKLLTHAVADGEDKLWPHKAIREGLEKWRAPQIEKGIYIGLMNSRGVTTRSPYYYCVINWVPFGQKTAHTKSIDGKFLVMSATSVAPGAQQKRFAAYLDRLAHAAGHMDRVVPLKSYCTGLLLPGERKSVEPMAARLCPENVRQTHQSLHHVVAHAPWSDDDLLEAVRGYVVPAMEKQGPIMAWIVDDTGLVKKGTHSVGVVRQYCGQVGKQENCQVAVSLSISTMKASLPIAWRLYLPETWTQDKERRKATGIPEGIGFQTKPEIALDQIRTALARQIPSAPVLADPGYGNDTKFRDGVTEAGLLYVAGVQSTLSVWMPGQAPLPKRKWNGMGRPTKLLRRDPQHRPVSARELAINLPSSAWKNVAWREGTRKPLRSRFAALRVRPAHRDYWMSEPRAEEWLLIEWPSWEPAPTKYWLSTLPAETKLRDLVRLAKQRWIIERDYEELKQELGLGHYEGRGWRGFHHHATLCIAAYGFLVAERSRFSPSARAGRLHLSVPKIPPYFRPRGSPHTRRAA